MEKRIGKDICRVATLQSDIPISTRHIQLPARGPFIERLKFQVRLELNHQDAEAPRRSQIGRVRSARVACSKKAEKSYCDWVLLGATRCYWLECSRTPVAVTVAVSRTSLFSGRRRLCE